MSTNKKLATNPNKWAVGSRRGKMNSTKWRKVMEDLEVTGNLEASAAHNGISKSAVYKYMERYPQLKEDYEIAREKAVRNLEMEAYRRAVEGTEMPIFHGGLQVGSYRNYSDRCLELLLKASRPDRFSNKAQIDVNHNHSISGDAKDKLGQLLGITDQSDGEIYDAEFTEVDDED